MQLSGAVNLYSAGDLQKRLLEQASKNDAIHLDLSSVESCDVAGFQLLLSCERTASKAGKSFHLANVPENLHSMAKALGIELPGISAH